MSISPKIHLNNFKLSRSLLFNLLVIFFLGLLLTIIYTWPMIFKLSTLYSDQEDYTLVGWILWYNQLSFKTGRIFSFTDYFNAFQFYPWPYSLAFSESLFFPSIIFSPFYWISKNLVLSVNLYTFLTFILTFISSFYVFRKLLNNISAAIISAVIFTFNPITAGHFPGHTHLLGKFFLPPLFLFLIHFFNNPTKKSAFLFGLFFTLNALTSITFFIISVPSIFLFGSPYITVNIFKNNIQYFKRLILSSLICAVFIPVLFYFLAPYYNFSHLENASRPLDETIYYSSQPIDWISTFPESPLYGNIVRSYEKIRVGYPKFNYSEHTLGTNILPSLLALIGFIILCQKKTFSYKWGIFCLLIGTTIFTFGPFKKGHYLPYYYFNQITHLLEGIRVPTRFQFFFYLPFSLAAGMGFVKLISIFPKNKTFILLTCITIITAENFMNWRIMDSVSSFTTQPEQFRQYQTFNFLKNKTTLHIPTFIGSTQQQAYYLNVGILQSEHLMNGYSGYYPNEWERLLLGIEKNFDQQSINKLKALKVDYVIFHKDKLPKDFSDHLKQRVAVSNELITFENNYYLILNLSTNKILTNICDPSQNLEILPLSNTFPKTISYTPLEIRNPHDCYVTNLLNKRYQKEEIAIEGKKYLLNLKMPVVLEPHEETILK